ncbi:MAG TPA: hypothetical protein VFV07_05240 [Rhizomicrobium sp.]|nr:hypothetical protein [Rhizomicrobium sp.]
MRTFSAGMLAAALLSSAAASAGGGVTVSRTLPGPIALSGQTAIASPIFRPVPSAAHLKQCFVVVEGMTAARPVGAQYEISVVSTGMDALPNDAATAGTISFYDAIGIPAAKTAPVSFEIPARYCHHDAYLLLKPVGGFNPASAPSIAAISLVAR